MIRQLRPAIISLVLLTVLTGGVYPLVITGLARAIFPQESKGSMLAESRGSELIGQPFDAPRYFWGRLSATTDANGKPLAYNAAASSGSNLGPTNPALADAAKARIDALKAVDPENAQPIPVDLVTASASGLDPHISPAAADYQVPRVARARKIPEAQVADLVARCVEGRQLGVLGEPRVNVLRLNLALDHPELAPQEPGRAAPSDHELHTTRGRGFMP